MEESRKKRSFIKTESRREKGERKPYSRKETLVGEGRKQKAERKPYSRKETLVGEGRMQKAERKPYSRKETLVGEGRKQKAESRREKGERKPYSRKETLVGEGRKQKAERKPYSRKETLVGEGRKQKAESRREKGERKFETENRKFETRNPRKRRDITAESEILSEIVETRRREGRSSPKKQKILSLEHEEKYGPIRLNKYISNSGICSRRDADMLIQTGAIRVNGQIVTELGTKVMPTDEVRYGDRILQREKPVYLLLNKPKDYITTMEDERDRKHVMELVRGACKERIYPVGRLDKNTTGLLLFTNDGEMTKKLTHPKHEIRKIYYVELNKNLTAADFEKIASGIELSDGEIKVDEIAYTGETKREIGITLHSGKNRIVRRIFEKLGYEIMKLDRVVFAGLTKKDLPRGKYRFLTEPEINILKMIKNKEL